MTFSTRVKEKRLGKDLGLQLRCEITDKLVMSRAELQVCVVAPESVGALCLQLLLNWQEVMMSGKGGAYLLNEENLYRRGEQCLPTQHGYLRAKHIYCVIDC